MALHADKVVFRTNEPVTATLLMWPALAQSAIPKIILEGDAFSNSSKSFTPVAAGDEPGTFRVLFETLPQGRYRARIAGGAASSLTSTGEIAFDVRGIEDERLDLAARGDLMARIAQESGGAVLATGSPGELVTQLQAARRGAGPSKSCAIPPGTAGGCCWVSSCSGEPRGCCAARRD